SLKPNPLAQIARQYLLLPRERNRRDIGIDRLELVGKRGSEKLDCCWRRRHHRCRGKILRPPPIGRAIDDRAITESVGGDDDRTCDLELLLQRRGHAASRAINASACAARQGVERATTSPITSMAGPFARRAASRAQAPRLGL